MMLTQAGTFYWCEKSFHSCGKFGHSDLPASNPPDRSVTEKVWLWVTATWWVKASVTGSSAETESPRGQNKHLTQCFPALLRGQMWRLVHFALTEVLEILPWHVSAECCPWPFHRIEGCAKGEGCKTSNYLSGVYLWASLSWCVIFLSV